MESEKAVRKVLIEEKLEREPAVRKVLIEEKLNVQTFEQLVQPDPNYTKEKISEYTNVSIVKQSGCHLGKTIRIRLLKYAAKINTLLQLIYK